MTLESRITARILQHLKPIPNSFSVKMHGSIFTKAGIPDVWFLYGARLFCFEVKRPGEKRSRIQEVIGDRLTRAGAIVMVVHSWEEVRACLRSFNIPVG